MPLLKNNVLNAQPTLTRPVKATTSKKRLNAVEFAQVKQAQLSKRRTRTNKRDQWQTVDLEG